MPSLAKTFDRQLLKKLLELTVSEDVLSPAKTLVGALDGIAAKARADFGAVPKKLAFVLMILKHIFHFMLVIYRDKRLL